MKTRKLYFIGAVVKQHEVSMDGIGVCSPLKLSWADGMIGVLPVFTNKQKAKKFAGKEWGIYSINAEMTKRDIARIMTALAAP